MTIATRKKMLIVEDEPNLVAIYQDAFRKTSHVEVSVAKDSKVAWEIIKKDHPDLILLDILIPAYPESNLDPKIKEGFKILKDLRNDQQLSHTNVIILTNLDDEKDMETAQQLGVLEYIIKSNIVPNELVERVLKYLE